MDSVLVCYIDTESCLLIVTINVTVINIPLDHRDYAIMMQSCVLCTFNFSDTASHARLLLCANVQQCRWRPLFPSRLITKKVVTF